MRIGILTFHRAYNCGAMLQAWALQMVLERMGHQVSFPANSENTLGGEPYRCAFSCRTKSGPLLKVVRSFVYRLLLTIIGKGGCGVRTGRYYEGFKVKFLNEQPCARSEFSKKYDAIVIGSDQVLNPRIGGWTEYFCGCRITDMPKVMYAASVGDGQLSDLQLQIIKQATASCLAVSVREPFDGYQVALDPTLLLDANDYSKIETAPDDSGYVYMYSCLATKFEIKCAREIARNLNRKLIITPTWGLYNRTKSKDLYGVISPDRMIGYIKNADYVIAGSFHGTALSIVYHKPFISIRDHVDMEESRPMAILKKLGLTERLVNPTNTVDEMMARLTKPIPEDAYRALSLLRKESLTWLASALEFRHA